MPRRFFCTDPERYGVFQLSRPDFELLVGRSYDRHVEQMARLARHLDCTYGVPPYPGRCACCMAEAGATPRTRRSYRKLPHFWSDDLCSRALYVLAAAAQEKGTGPCTESSGALCNSCYQMVLNPSRKGSGPRVSARQVFDAYGVVYRLPPP